MLTRIRKETGEALLSPQGNKRKQVSRITGNTGKSTEVERVAEGRVVPRKLGNAGGGKAPCCEQYF